MFLCVFVRMHVSVVDIDRDREGLEPVFRFTKYQIGREVFFFGGGAGVKLINK